jgi:two-component system, cell cycle sensor histidine kinase and response regulator CckA
VIREPASDARFPDSTSVTVVNPLSDRSTPPHSLPADAVRESEAHHRRVLDSLPVIVFRAEPAPPYATTYVNEAIETLGYTRAEWLARPDMWESRLHPKDRLRMRRQALDCLERAEPMDCEYRLLAKNGSVHWFHARGDFVPDECGERCVWQGIMLDVTVQREAEEALRESEARHRLIFDEAGIGMAVCTLDGRTELANAALCEFLGYPRDELLGMNYRQVMHPDELALDRRESEALLGGAIARFTHERRYLRKDGSEVWGLLTVALLRDAEGAPSRRIAQVQDITERKHAEVALRESEARTRTLVETAHEGIWAVDQVGVTTYVNTRLCEMLDYTAQELLGRPCFDFMSPEMAFGARTMFARRQRGISEVHELTLRRRDASELFVLMSTSPLLAAEGEFAGALAMVTDITERRRATQRLEESEVRFRLAAQATNDVLYDWNISADTHFWGESLQSGFGYDPREVESTYDWWAQQIHPADIAHVTASISAALNGDAESWSEEYRFRRRDESYARVLDRGYVLRDAQGKAIRLVGSMIDLTEHRELEEQFRQAQKMEAVGRLAGGVAHDFNNLLTVIKASTGFLLEGMDAADPRREDARQIAAAADRAAGLTRQLLAFSRKQLLDPTVLDPNAVVRNLRPMLARLIGEDVEVETRLHDGLGSIMADVGQLEQVLINLAINARDAMPDGGRIMIETAEVTLDERYSAGYARRERSVVLPGDYVMLVMTDTGTGMSPEVRARVFEPFYTTKPAGKGTGLGLSTVYGIVKQSGGHIWVYSEPGEGTVFKLYFPRLDAAAIAPLTRSAERPARGSETVLLVEDEEAVRRLARRVLEQQGYRVLESHNGREALALATAHDGQIDLVLTDVVMPEMSGRGLVERLSAVRPNAVVVYMSGYTDDDVLRRGMLAPGSRFIQKPFAVEALLRLVREALDRRSASQRWWRAPAEATALE